MSDQETETSKSLAGVRGMICNRSDKKYKIIENILKHNNCINGLISAIQYSSRQKAIGNTLLHLALRDCEHDTFNFLINQGADFTLKNTNGETVLHQAFRKSITKKKECDKLWGKLNHPYIDSALSAHVEARNSSNPSNKNGLTHLHIACMVNHVKSVEFFLKNGVSVNQAVDLESPSLAGYTPLHFAARYCAYETVLILLEHGADVNAKDAKGMSPLHLLIERNTEIADWLDTDRRTNHETFIKELSTNERIVASLLKRLCNGTTSVIDDKGFTPLHLACTLRDTSLAQKLLRRGHKVELPVHNVSPLFPGYTPLHFAAHFSMEMVKLLLRSGADIASRDAKGTRPFDICLKKLYIADDLHILIASQPAWGGVGFSDGKTTLLDFALAMHKRDSLHAFLCSIDINMRLQADSPLWAGYTPLHLFVLFVESSNEDWDLYESSDYTDDVTWHDMRMVDAIELCLKLGADVTIQDCRGYSPLHLAFHLQKVYLVGMLLKAHRKICNPVAENGLAHFHIACVVRNTDLVVRLLKNRKVDVNSPVTFSFQLCRNKNIFAFAKGSTPLHIAVITRNCELANVLLNHGANYELKDDDALTPVHRLFGLSGDDEASLADALLSSYNLSFMNDNVAPTTKCGLTYLHVVSYWQNDAAVEKLLDLGADINATITYKPSVNQDSGRFRCRDIQSECSIDSLTFLERYTGYTPLHLAIEQKNYTVVKILVQRGADILAKHSDALTPLYEILNSKYSSDEMLNLFVDALLQDVTLQSRMADDSGLTMLHVACATSDIQLIKHLCSQGLDVNTRTHMDSPIWPGYTPLHVLMLRSKDNIDHIVNIIKLLLNCGADVTIINADQNTPIHEDFERFFVLGPRFASLLLKAQRDFSKNPVNMKGISHFHIACSCKEVAVVEEFLKHGADINLPINHFCEFYGGLTPLHLASVHHLKNIFMFLGQRQIDIDHAIHHFPALPKDPMCVASADDCKKTVDILLKYGANPNIVDRFGNTSIHVAVASELLQEDIWQSLVRAGAELNVENYLNETAIEILLSSETITSQMIEFFLRHGSSINVYSPVDEEGFVSKIFLICQDNKHIQDALYQAMSNVPDICYFDETGRNLIHNIVSHSAGLLEVNDYINSIENFENFGHEVDHRDRRGQTPLHVAIKFRNLKAVIGLLECGADINVLNQSDQARLILEEFKRNIPPSIEKSSLLKNLCAHIYKLKLRGIYINSIIRKLDTRMRRKCRFNFRQFERLCTEEVKQLKKTNIEPYSLTLYDFLSETGVVAAYPMLSAIKRRAICDFFRNNGSLLRSRYPHLWGLVKLQLKKAINRVTLLEPAKVALSVVMGNYIPDLCSEAVLRFLTNEDLNNLMVFI